MNLRAALIPVALVAGLAFAANDAVASPITPGHGGAVFGPRIHVGGGIGIDIPLHVRSRRRAYRPAYRPARVVAPAPAGYYRTVRERVWHPPELVGYDSHGYPAYSEGHWDYVERRVWVPAPVVVRRPVMVRPRIVPRVHVGLGIGGRWRIR